MVPLNIVGEKFSLRTPVLKITIFGNLWQLLLACGNFGQLWATFGNLWQLVEQRGERAKGANEAINQDVLVGNPD